MTSDAYLSVPIPVRYRFVFKATESIILPDYQGSTWRGLLGHGLRKTACVTGQPTCKGCLLIESCVYNQIFESHASGTNQNRYTNHPHPFTLQIDDVNKKTVEADDHLQLGITLFAHRTGLAYLIQGFLIAGRSGIGKTRGKFELTEVLCERQPGSDDWRPVWRHDSNAITETDNATLSIPQAPNQVTIRLLSPLRSKRQGKLLGPREFDNTQFLTQLWRRIHELSHFYSKQTNTVPIPTPKDRPDHMTTENASLSWKDWTRYSSRQKSTMQMGGVIGSWTVTDKRLTEWWPMLWYGQWVHLGKATSMGLGCYRLDDTTARAQPDIEHKTDPIQTIG